MHTPVYVCDANGAVTISVFTPIVVFSSRFYSAFGRMQTRLLAILGASRFNFLKIALQQIKVKTTAQLYVRVSLAPDTRKSVRRV